MTQTHQRYDLAVIGAGSAGLSAAIAGLQLGVKVALIEGKRTGGNVLGQAASPVKHS